MSTNKKKIIVLIGVLIIIVIAVGVCIGFLWYKSENTKEQIKNINYYFDLTLPKDSEIVKYKYEKTDDFRNAPDVVLQAKVAFPKNKYDEFISSIRDYADRSDIPGGYGGNDVPWWNYDISKVKDTIEILESPKDIGENGMQKMTAYTYAVVVENGDNCEVYLCYYG